MLEAARGLGLILKVAQRLGFGASWNAKLRQSEFEAVTQADRLSEAIVESVLSGEFPPGLRLDEGMLADRYSVSRTPVREALRQLASTGLIELKPRRGATVATATSAQLEALFGAMAEIEATCARLAGRRLAPFRRAQFRTEGRTSRSNAEHAAVVKAILACDPSAAHTAMIHHMSLVEDSFGQLGAASVATAGSGDSPPRPLPG